MNEAVGRRETEVCWRSEIISPPAAEGPDETQTNFPKQSTSQAVTAPLTNAEPLRAQRDKERSTQTFVKDVLQ